MKITRTPVYVDVLSNVSMQELIPLHEKIMKKVCTVRKNSNIETVVIKE